MQTVFTFDLSNGLLGFQTANFFFLNLGEKDVRAPANLFVKHPPKCETERVQISRDETMTHANEKSIARFDVSSSTRDL